MIERIAQFGPDKRLTGLVAAPTADLKSTGETALILLNAGTIHHVGPFRMYVELSRTLAEFGLTTLRFDLSGLGDSLPRPGAATAEERRRLDVVDAMDYLQAKGSANRFILGGLCSGAYLTHHMALADDRVAGAIFLDGYAFRTPAYHRVRFVERYLSVDRWRKYVRRQLNRARAVERDVPFRPDDEYFDALPSKSQLRADVARLLERGVKSLWLYTGGVPELFAGGAQFKQMFGDIVGFERLDYRFFNDVEHTFPFKDDRSRLRRAVVEWIRSRFPECVRASETKSNELNASSID